VATGTARLTLDGDAHDLVAGSTRYIPPAYPWTLWKHGDTPLGSPIGCVNGMVPARDRCAGCVSSTHDKNVAPIAMPDYRGAWVNPAFADLVTCATNIARQYRDLPAAGRIPFAETM